MEPLAVGHTSQDCDFNNEDLRVAFKPNPAPTSNNVTLEGAMPTFCQLLKEHLLTCRRLEAIADSLPNNINVRTCIAIAEHLPPRLATIHKIEDEVIHPLLRTTTAGTPFGYDLDRLQDEHQIDQDYAEEVSEMLMLLASKRKAHMEHAGYLLRGFFHSSRRHVHFDLEIIMPHISPRLDQPALNRIREILHTHQSILPASCVTAQSAIRNHQPRATP